MPIQQVTQLRFVRGKWLEGLDGVTEDEALKRFEPMNSIGWLVGHLASHEQVLLVDDGARQRWLQGTEPISNRTARQHAITGGCFTPVA